MTFLTLVDHLRVTFDGCRAAEGPMTLGQLNTFDWVTKEDEPFYGIVPWYVNLPNQATLDDVREAAEVVMVRHESLRTTFHGGSVPAQRVTGSGELMIEVHEISDAPEVDAQAAPPVRELITRLQGSRFDLARDLPVRMAVMIRSGAPVGVVLACSHMAVDYTAMSVVARQFAELVADPAVRSAGPRTHQPLDQAAAEQVPPLRRWPERALRHWEELMRRTPRCLYAVPYHPEQDDGSGAGWLHSPAAAMALPHITTRTASTRSIAVLAALFTLLSWRTGRRECMFVSLLNNRFEPRLRDYVGTLAQETLIAVDTAVASFDELVRRAGTATFRTARYGLYNVHQLQPVVRKVCHRRGIDYERDLVVNLVAWADDTPTPPRPLTELARALPDTKLTWWRQPPGNKSLLLFDMVEVGGQLVFGFWTGDTGRISRSEVEMLLRGLERILVAAAAGDFELARIGEITGIAPVERGPDWHQVDGSWIELPEVQRLLDEALAVPAARAFAIDSGGDGGTTLLAYLAAGDGIRSPEQAHDACLAGLPGRYAAIAPSQYVICDHPPADPSDLAQWQCRPVLAQGDGRRARAATMAGA